MENDWRRGVLGELATAMGVSTTERSSYACRDTCRGSYIARKKLAW